MKVRIVRHPSNYIKVGEIDVESIGSVRWDNISGGYNNRSGGYSLYGYISYDKAVELVDCSGKHDLGHNDAKVCIPESLNRGKEYKEGYQYLKDHAINEKPQSKISKNRPDGWGPCTKCILKILEKRTTITRKELREMIGGDDSGKEGYNLSTI